MTNRGKVRKNNQDAYYCNISNSGTVALVCDGMGGAAAGDTASRLAAETFVDELQRPVTSIPKLMRDAAAEANSTVYHYSEEHPECRGMGTTLVAAVAVENQAHVINIGDSRCYYLDEDGIRQVTQDHSVVADLVRRGAITPEEARTHPKKNLITRALGTHAECQADIFQVKMKPNSMLLLCSDGLTNQVTDQEILFEALYGGEPDTCCQRLVDLTLRRGAPDNVTVVLLLADGRGC
ncbi:MAG: Stp1/IreP family PP2C-type Ser/Thr phosphatase [Oscillospiraceae bacterium]|nr:Stp1/IreP family PP2C-type Ser/Thr phosphatase [Oscillospiraceae bacterium]